MCFVSSPVEGVWLVNGLNGFPGRSGATQRGRDGNERMILQLLYRGRAPFPP